MRLSTTADPSDRGQLPLAVTMGEPAGVGPPIIATLWQERRQALPPAVILGDANVFRAHAPQLPTKVISRVEDVWQTWPTHLPVLQTGSAGPIHPGEASIDAAPMVINAIDMAVTLALEGLVAGIVTGPIQKSVLNSAGFPVPGHTEYLAIRCGLAADASEMMLVASGLRTVPLTIHTALRNVPSLITEARVTAALHRIHGALRQDFAIAEPRIAVAGLNPHAGEDGLLGQEEIETLSPVITRLRQQGMLIEGPLSADTMFHAEARTRFDAALCMYHDQALIPVKSLDFWGGVNVTLGLPVVRTSPDHGTALSVSRSGQADTRSFQAAWQMAAEIAINRRAAGQ